MQEFERASLHKDFVNEENNTGSYIFEPLERGFGITIGNTICRTLLTSVPGTRIVGFKVSGFDGKATMIDFRRYLSYFIKFKSCTIIQ